MCEISSSIIPLFQSFTIFVLTTRGDAPHVVRRLPHYQGRRASRCSALASLPGATRLTLFGACLTTRGDAPHVVRRLPHYQGRRASRCSALASLPGATRLTLFGACLTT